MCQRQKTLEAGLLLDLSADQRPPKYLHSTFVLSEFDYGNYPGIRDSR
jgi:hypothetical protein